MRRIVLPQALRTAFPSLSNSLIAMVKDTSLAANITVTEMFMVTQRIVARTYEPLALYIEIGLIYLMFSTVLTKLQRFGERKLSLQNRPKSGVAGTAKVSGRPLVPAFLQRVPMRKPLCPMENVPEQPCYQDK